MELDWYGRATVNMASSSSSNSRWRTNDSISEPDKQASRWSSLLNLIQDRGFFSPRSSVDDCSSRGYLSSPKLSPQSPKSPGAQLTPACARSLSGEGSLSSKSHVCFACVLHHHN